MLSPSMRTNSNGKIPWYSAMRRPTSNCGLRPVPLSPMTAKRTDFAACGSFKSTAGLADSPDNMTRTRTCFDSLWNCIADKIDNQVRLRVAQNQAVTHETVFELGRKPRQIHE